MEWTVEFNRRALKQVKKLDKKTITALQLLIQDLKQHGPAPGKIWANYGKLASKKNHDLRHCHLIKGKPTCVCCWEVIDKKIKVIEVYYVGTHEKAPY